MAFPKTFPNKFAGTCCNCHEPVAAGAGTCERNAAGKWQVKCATPCEAKPKPVIEKPACAAVGELTGILKLFEVAGKQKKFPAVLLSVPETALTVRIYVCGPKSKVPGSISVENSEKGTGFQGRREWYGRVMQDGTFEPTKSAAKYMPSLANRLAAFAADPAGVAAADGKLNCRCCFCGDSLENEKSTEVGYGPVCAKKFGLPYGKKFSFEAVAA